MFYPINLQNKVIDNLLLKESSSLATAKLSSQSISNLEFQDSSMSVHCKDLDDIINKLHILRRNGQLIEKHLQQLKDICIIWATGANIKIIKLMDIPRSNKKFGCQKCGESFISRSEYLAHMEICRLKRSIDQIHKKPSNNKNKYLKKTISSENSQTEYKLDFKDMNELEKISNEMDDNSYSEFVQKLEKNSMVNVGLKLLTNSVVNNGLIIEDSNLDVPVQIEVKDRENKDTTSNKIHSRKSRKILGSSFFSCSICAKYFSTSLSLQRHMMTHSTDRPYACNICSSAYKQKEFLKIHHTKHTDVHKYKCMYCNMSTYLKRSLTVHMRIHTQERRYVCSECGMRFAYSNSLNLHSRTHTGERPFKCTDCEKRFSSKSNLRAHRLLHTGEKNFKCESCGRMFMTQTALKKHSRQHNGDRPFNCNICDKSFCISSTLKSHMKIHTGERAYVCHICLKSFIRNAHLIRHLQAIHKLKSDLTNKNAFINLGHSSGSDNIISIDKISVVNEVKKVTNANEDTNSKKDNLHLKTNVPDQIDIFPIDVVGTNSANSYLPSQINLAGAATTCINHLTDAKFFMKKTNQSAVSSYVSTTKSVKLQNKLTVSRISLNDQTSDLIESNPKIESVIFLSKSTFVPHLSSPAFSQSSLSIANSNQEVFNVNNRNGVVSIVNNIRELVDVANNDQVIFKGAGCSQEIYSVSNGTRDMYNMKSGETLTSNLSNNIVGNVLPASSQKFKTNLIYRGKGNL